MVFPPEPADLAAGISVEGTWSDCDRLLQHLLTFLDPANLTEREAEVLKLIASGKSTRQIAHTLVLSEKTVTNHLTHIFTKTASENRAAATAFAFHHGLA